MSGVCDGADHCVECLGPGDCLAPGESCVDHYCIAPVEVVCSQVCQQIGACVGLEPGCQQACEQDLSDCSSQQIDKVVSCGWALDPDCDLDAFTSCMGTIACIEL